jgi:hypothetical protein
VCSSDPEVDVLLGIRASMLFAGGAGIEPATS